MILNVNLIDPIPPKEFEERIDNFVNEDGFAANHCKILPLSKIGLILSFYNNSIAFNMYRDDERQKSLIKKWIKGVFGDSDIVYCCDGDCSWVEELENKKIRVY